MHKIIKLLLAMAVLSFTVAAQKSDDRSAALGVVNKLFDEMAAANPQGIIDLHTGPESQLAGIRKMKDGKMRLDMIGRDAFSKFFTDKSAVIKETMYAPKVEVDGDWAMVWGRYVFWVSGKLSHCGIDQFNLVRTDAGWKIANGASTIDPGGCTEKEKAMKPDGASLSKEKSK
ncbi:MAG: hypothetical protein IT173_12300 [Acidobacteria bacterium]|nr:hypothetical protein [Acidobacteriota bacterium]